MLGCVQEVDLTGSRDFLTADAAAALLQPLLENSAVITKEDEALEVLRIICKALTGTKLQRLNLSDNALGEKGIRACADALTSQGGLESLALQNIGCSIHACKAVGELLASAALRQLHLYNNMSDNEGAQHIAAVLARSPAMEDFRMASSRVGPEGGIALAEALGAGSSLVKLDLSDNPMTEEVAPALGRCLALQPQLRILNLNDTGLCDTGISELMSALAAASSQLRELELALNEITPKGASAVARYLVTAQGLERLNLRENEMGDRGVVVVARALQASTTLRALDLCQNQVRRVGAVAAAQATANKPAFELLALDENEISEEGIEQLEAAMTKVFGHTKFLGPLDENDPDADEEEEGDDDEEEEELTAAMGASSLS